MGSWENSSIIVYFNNSEHKTLIIQAMECLGFGHEKDSFIFFDDSYPEGPKITTKKSTEELYYSANGGVNINDLVCLLNQLFSGISVYSIEECGSTVNDYVTGEEHSYDLSKKTHYIRKYDWCYGDCTAFGEYIDIDEDDDDGFEILREKGTIIETKKITKQSLKTYTLDSLKMLKSEAVRNGYTELAEMAEKIPVPKSESQSEKAK